MSQAINSITLALPYKLGSVNCYLIDTTKGYTQTNQIRYIPKSVVIFSRPKASPQMSTDFLNGRMTDDK